MFENEGPNFQGKDADLVWPILSATIISRDHWNYTDKAKNPQNLASWDTLPTANFPLQKMKSCCGRLGMKQATCASIQITSWRNGIKSRFLLNWRHSNIIYRAANSPGSWTLLLLCKDPHVKDVTSWSSICLRTEIWTSKQKRP